MKTNDIQASLVNADISHKDTSVGDNIFPEDQQIPVFQVPPGLEIGLLHTHKHLHIHTVSHSRDSRVVEVRPHIYHFNSSFTQGRLYKKQCSLARLADIKHWQTGVQVAFRTEMALLQNRDWAITAGSKYKHGISMYQCNMFSPEYHRVMAYFILLGLYPIKKSIQYVLLLLWQFILRQNVHNTWLTGIFLFIYTLYCVTGPLLLLYKIMDRDIRP